MNGSYVNGYSLAGSLAGYSMWDFWQHSGSGKGFSHSTSAFPRQYHSTSDPE